MMDIVEDMPCEMRHIFHPTDFSPASMAAFGYALKLSLGMKSDLTIMHVDPARADPDFEDFPRVRATLIRWGLLKEGATKEDLLALGLGVRKIRAMDVVKEVIGELKTKGKVTRPWLGVGGKFVTEEIRELFLLPLADGLLVEEVYPGSPAVEAGLHAKEKMMTSSWLPEATAPLTLTQWRAL